MTLETKDNLGHGGTGFQGTGPGSAAAMIKELQGLTTNIGDGTTAATNIAVAGIALEDTLQSVIMFAGGVPSDVTSEASITSAGNIQLSTTDSTGNKLLITWFNKNA